MVLSRLTLALLLLDGCSPIEPLREPHVEARRDELRPTDTSSSEMWRFLPTDTVENFELPDAGTRVHFTRAGKNAVPAADTNTNGTPDLVESVASVYVEVAAKYHAAMGFRFPVGDLALGSNGGNERFDIYLVDFGLQADGAFRLDSCTNERCIGYVVQENDFVGYHNVDHRVDVVAFQKELGLGARAGKAIKDKSKVPVVLCQSFTDDLFNRFVLDHFSIGNQSFNSRTKFGM